MPTVLRHDGFAVMIYTNDHVPAHVHVFKAGEKIIINLGGDETGIKMRENVSMSRQNARQAVSLVEENREALIERWNEIHG